MTTTAKDPMAAVPSQAFARVVFVDCETNGTGTELLDFGAADTAGEVLHSTTPEAVRSFIGNARFLCGHNVFALDKRFTTALTGLVPGGHAWIDTLALSVLLFPQKRFHALLKDEKLLTGEMNNPTTDALKARDLFFEELTAWQKLAPAVRTILAALLSRDIRYRGFFAYAGETPAEDSAENLARTIREAFPDAFCANAILPLLIKTKPADLGLVLAFLAAGDSAELLPLWTVKTFPAAEDVLTALCGTPCRAGCPWCSRTFNARHGLKTIFGFEAFRTYGGEPLQERAAQAALEGDSLLAVFPTGGGKSITFQIPALMQAKATRSLTVVISPLQSLMKDQVDNLTAKGIDGAYTVNGLLSPVERARAFDAVVTGEASLLYISPEQLRSVSIERVLSTRRIARFVIDEAHCFSAWGHDFRTDYLYIGDFIARLEKLQGARHRIAVSCFTATAKQKVIQDICEYFREKLGLELKLFTTEEARKNLRYKVLHAENDTEKTTLVRELLSRHPCPTIIYMSSTKGTEKLAEKLTAEGFKALPYHGQMDAALKIEHQEAFLSGAAQVITATNAFGMGVDKKDVGLVIHYDISASLENYVQEAGRAGRDPNLEADCYVLFNEDDLDRHFAMLTQSKLSQADIQLVWRAIKQMTRTQESVPVSALELARTAGWDTETIPDLETRIKTALSALETAGYIRRGRNVSRVYATSIAAKSFEEARQRMEVSPYFQDDESRVRAGRILQALISKRSRSKADAGESRTDYLSDRLGIPVDKVVESVNALKLAGILRNENDMAGVLMKNARTKTADAVRLEQFLFTQLSKAEHVTEVNLKALNAAAGAAGLTRITPRLIGTLLRHMKRTGVLSNLHTIPATSVVRIKKAETFADALESLPVKAALSEFILTTFEKAARAEPPEGAARETAFSTTGLLTAWEEDAFRQQAYSQKVTVRDIENTLLFMADAGALRLQGGFMVLYQGMLITRLVTDPKRRYRAEDYKLLDGYYRQKLQQIHIVGEYANLMMRDYEAALTYVHDYFALDYNVFLRKYFAADRREEMRRGMTAARFKKLFADLTETQFSIIDEKAQFVVVAAGPGSGKTRVLVHKLAALLLLEDVRPEQLLMLTFSRAAAGEFKKRLIELIGKKAAYVDIKTFHSYAFDLLGRPGSLEETRDVVSRAAALVKAGGADPARTAKTTLVIDEAQDMSREDFALVMSLIDSNNALRVIAVGDDDQNIYAFRGSDSRYLKALLLDKDAARYEMTENWRSTPAIVTLADAFAGMLHGRLKTTPNRAVKTENGIVRIVRHTRPGFEAAISEEIAAALKAGTLKGSTALLTVTNEEARLCAVLLADAGVRVRLIEGEKKLNFCDLLETRTLLHFLKKRAGAGGLIEKGVWNEARDFVKDRYQGSPWVENVTTVMKAFEGLTPTEHLYLSDFADTVTELKLEETYTAARGLVTVSTMHKAKGREFENVWLLASRTTYPDDEARRVLYVAMTRAKTNLFVHAASGVLSDFTVEGVEHSIDTRTFPAPREIAVALGHDDVFLDWFIARKQRIFTMTAGMLLTPAEHGLTIAGPEGCDMIVRFSKSFEEKLAGLTAKGYRITRAAIRAIVAWKKTEDETLYPVVLPELRLTKATDNAVISP